MKILTKGVYFVKEVKIIKGKIVKDKCGEPLKIIRLWHDCTEYQRRKKKEKERRRIELKNTSENKDSILFECPYCDFAYSLDKYLNI